MFFNEFMDDIAKNHGLLKDVDGVTVSLKMVLPKGANVHVVYDALDPNKRGYVRMGVFVAPTTREGRHRFMNYLLTLNRDALVYLDAGLTPHPQGDDMFTFTWYAPKRDQIQVDWMKQLELYEDMGLTVIHNIQKIMTEWTHSVH